MDRYARQAAQIGARGQERLAAAHAFIVGVGALGSVAAELLCRAGIGRMTICDYDIVEESNLQRQGLYTSADIGKQKTAAAAAHLRAINPAMQLTIADGPFSAQTPLAGVDIIIDGTDSLETRFLLNDRAKQAGIPLIIGTASQTRGMVYAVTDGPCWQCVLRGKTATDDCDSGVLGMATHAVASLQAAAAVRTILGDAPKELFEIDVWSMDTRRIRVERNNDCAACTGEYHHLAQPFTIRFCSATHRLQARPSTPTRIDIANIPDVMQRYASAVRVRVGAGTALVHQHGLVEFEDVDEREARMFVNELLL